MGASTIDGVGLSGVVVIRERTLANVGYVEVGAGEAGEGEVSGDEFLPGLAAKRNPVAVFCLTWAFSNK